MISSSRQRKAWKVDAVAAERDEARAQVLQLGTERPLEQAFAQGRGPHRL